MVSDTASLAAFITVAIIIAVVFVLVVMRLLKGKGCHCGKKSESCACCTKHSTCGKKDR